MAPDRRYALPARHRSDTAALLWTVLIALLIIAAFVTAIGLLLYAHPPTLDPS